MLNAIFLAGSINKENILILPQIFAKRYRKVLVSISSSVSFLFLLAGNLVGTGLILSNLLGVSQTAGVIISTVVIWMYTASGGLLSVAYTDVIQGLIGWIGCMACSYWFLVSSESKAPLPSSGFPGYIYPDLVGDKGVCDLYQGASCVFNTTKCCFNPNTTSILDNGAYPIGDKTIFRDQMSSITSRTPFPNVILWNWATIFILVFGNLAGLDFQSRCMASKGPRTAQLGF